MSQKSDDAVTSVVGEMLILVLAVVLVSLFAVSSMNLLPGERGEVVEVMMNSSNTTHLVFWHKGGDWVKSEDIVVTATANGTQNPLSIENVLDCFGNQTSVFDLGGSISVSVPSPSGTYDIRVATQRSVIYSGVYSTK